MLVETLQNVAHRRAARVTFLSGDVHAAALGQFYTHPKMANLREDFRYMPQVNTRRCSQLQLKMCSENCQILGSRHAALLLAACWWLALGQVYTHPMMANLREDFRYDAPGKHTPVRCSQRSAVSTVKSMAQVMLHAAGLRWASPTPTPRWPTCASLLPHAPGKPTAEPASAVGHAGRCTQLSLLHSDGACASGAGSA